MAFGMRLAYAVPTANFATLHNIMKQLSTLLLAALMGPFLQAQSTFDLVVFSEDGSKFTLVVDGETKNEEPATRVVATGIRNETPRVVARFADSSIPPVSNNLYLPLGMEYTVVITTNKKGVRVFRPQGEAALGTAARSEPASKPAPTTFVEDKPAAPPAAPAVRTDVQVGGVETVTTTVVVEEEDMDVMDGEKVNISMGVNGVGINMDVRVDERGMDMRSGTTTGTATRTTTRTTTTTTTTSTPAVIDVDVAPEPVKEPEVYRMPGYTGPVGCAWPMSSTEFEDARKSIEGKSFEDTKMTLAKQLGRDRCFTVEQVKGIMGLFSFEDSKLDFAKYAYDRTYDIGNYFKLNDAFTFESSVEELNDYLESR